MWNSISDRMRSISSRRKSCKRGLESKPAIQMDSAAPLVGIRIEREAEIYAKGAECWDVEAYAETDAVFEIARFETVYVFPGGSCVEKSYEAYEFAKPVLQFGIANQPQFSAYRLAPAVCQQRLWSDVACVESSYG